MPLFSQFKLLNMLSIVAVNRLDDLVFLLMSFVWPFLKHISKLASFYVLAMRRSVMQLVYSVASYLAMVFILH